LAVPKMNLVTALAGYRREIATVARGCVVPEPPPGPLGEMTDLETARTVVRRGTGMVARGWIVPFPPWAFAEPEVLAVTAR
jgi:hypothetical protein